MKPPAEEKAHSQAVFQPRPTPWDWTLLGLLAASSAAFRAGHEPSISFFFGIAALLVLVSFFAPVRNLFQVRVVLAVGWALSALSLGDLKNFQYAFAPLGGMALPNPLLNFSIGFGLLLAFWRFLPPARDKGDLSPAVGRVWFWGILALAVFLRFQHIQEATGVYWDDPGVCIIDPQGILNFHEHPLLFPLGQREPFFSYFLAGLWELMPHAHAIFIQRLGGAILDLAAVVLFYFAGKEAGGIWVGLVAEAAAAFSKPLLIENLIGMTAVTVPLAVALLLWTTFRLFNRTSWGRFIQWGLALGFAPYNYTPIRTWLPFIITVVLAWLFFHKLKGLPKSWVEILLGCGTLTVWILGFLKVNNFLPESDLNLGAAAKGAVVMLLAALAVVQWRGHQRESDRNWVSAFFLSVLLATALMYPLASDPEISVHTSGLSIFHNQETRTFHYENSVLDQMLKKTGNTLETMFVGGQDRGDLNLPWDAFFEYHFLPLLLLGLAAFLSRPGWLSLFLVLGGFVGISTHILSIDPHSAKMVAAVAPLAILCGLGIRQLAASLSARSRKVSLGISFAVLAYLGWAVWGTYDRVWGHYFKIGGVDKIVSQAVGDLADRYRLYMGVYRDFASPESQSLLDEGHNVYLLQPYNPIFLRPGEAPRDLAVLLQPSDPRADLVRKEFKDATDTLVKSNKEGTPTVLRIVKIPAADIPAGPGKLFGFERVGPGAWIREYFDSAYLLGAGVLDYVEKVDSPYGPVPSAQGGHMLRILGEVSVPAKTTWRLSVTTANYAILKLDGCRVLDLKPNGRVVSRVRTLTLGPGDHAVDYLVYLRVGNEIPEIKIEGPGGSVRRLGDPPPPAAPSAFQLGRP